MSKLIDITGQRFGKLTVLEKGDTVKGVAFWLCKCDCGKLTTVTSAHLRNGHTRSCGCLAQELKYKPNKFDLSGEYGVCYFNNGGSFIFDKEDYDKLKDYCWIKTTAGYALYKGCSKTLLAHRVVINCPPDLLVDHINHNTLDNRKCNLRICTQAQNLHNRKAKGYSKEGDVYRVYIGKKHLGSYRTEAEAIIARKEAEQKYYGEFAYKEGEKNVT